MTPDDRDTRLIAMPKTERPPVEEIRARAEKSTEGPWCVWEGHEYEGGGADLCIGRGEKWLANMDHRTPRCPQILDSGHKSDECDICTIDSGDITEEQRANAEHIAHSRTDVPALCDYIARLESEAGQLRSEIERLTRALGESDAED